MDYYAQYPIRCKTCNEQIACFAAQHLLNLEEPLRMTVEESLNSLGIMNYCSRIAMMNPTLVAFNMQNREAIEGLRKLTLNDEAGDNLVPYQGEYNFVTCRKAALQTVVDKPAVVRGRRVVEAYTALPEQGTRQGIKDISFASGDERIPLPETKERPIFESPTTVGLPRINPDPSFPDQTLSVGVGRTVKVLAGRTYLAR